MTNDIEARLREIESIKKHHINDLNAPWSWEIKIIGELISLARNLQAQIAKDNKWFEDHHMDSYYTVVLEENMEEVNTELHAVRAVVGAAERLLREGIITDNLGRRYEAEGPYLENLRRALDACQKVS
jgi:hypothetical protein